MSERRHIEHWFSAEDEVCLTHEQMQGYAEGKLVATEKNSVERHLLNCELCAMAYEGLAEMESADVAAAVSSITDQAWGRVEQLSKRNQRSAYFWMSSAAAILLLIVVGFFLVDRQNKLEMKELADGMFELPQTEQAESLPLDDAPVFAERKQEALDPVVPPPPPKMAAPQLEPVPMEEELEYEEAEILSRTAAPEEVVVADDIEDADASFDDFDGIVDQQAYDELVESDEEVAFSGVDDRYDFKEVESGIEQTVTSVNKPIQENNAQLGNSFGTVTLDSVAAINGLNGGFVEGATYADVEVADEPVRSIAENKAVPADTKDLWANVEDSKNDDEVLAVESSAPVRAYSSSPGKKRNRREKGKLASKSEIQKEERSGKFYDKESMDNDPAAKSPSLFDQGMAAYQKSDFEGGARLLRQASIETPSNLYAHFYAGICYLQLEQATAALFHLERVLEQPNNSLEEDAQWYKSIALLQQGEKRKAKTMLEEINRAGRSRSRDARKALEKLDQP